MLPYISYFAMALLCVVTVTTFGRCFTLRWALILICLVPPVVLGQSSGGSFTITSHVAAGGGCGPDGRGGCTQSIGSGNLSLDGTAAEPGAAELSRTSPFSLRGGFWYGTLGNTPTAAPASIGGRVTSPDGAPLGGVVIRLSDARMATTITDSSGDYHFDNVDTNTFYTVTPLLVNYHFTPASRSLSLVGNRADAVFTANADSSQSANAIDMTEYFVRQQFLDFLGREPDQEGLGYWSGQLGACGSDLACINARRIGVSAAFFIEQEFQETGSFVYRMYKASLGRQPSYAEFSADRSKVVGGATLREKQQAFADEWVARGVFKQQYPETMTASEFVNKLFDTVGLQAFDQRQQQIDAMTNNGKTRAAVLRDSIEIKEFKTREYNRSFVLMQYFGYLRRDPDQGGYDFWVNVLSNGDVGNYRGMVCSFVTSTEYQRRFSSVVSHTNDECGQ